MGTIWAEFGGSLQTDNRSLLDKKKHTFQLATPSGDDAAGSLRLRDLARMRHADDVDMRPTSSGLDETEQSDIVGQRQIVKLRMDHHVRHVELLVGQLLGGDADVVFTETDLEHGADVAAGQTAIVESIRILENSHLAYFFFFSSKRRKKGNGHDSLNLARANEHWKYVALVRLENPLHLRK